MGLFIINNHIQYHHIDITRCVMLGSSYFSSPDYLVVKSRIQAMI